MNDMNNGHEYVDLGADVMWATCNVGASSPEEFGYYFAWGETAPKEDYSWESYKYWKDSLGKDPWCKATFNKYNTRKEQGVVDNRMRLILAEDAAHLHWGGSWHMPSTRDLQFLRNMCRWTGVTQNGTDGYRVTSQLNGNSIFLPCTGVWMGKTRPNYWRFETGGIWSAELWEDKPFWAYSLSFGYSSIFEDDMIDIYSQARCYGLPVRPVAG